MEEMPAYKHQGSPTLLRRRGCSFTGVSRRRNLTANFLFLWLLESFCSFSVCSLSLRFRNCVIDLSVISGPLMVTYFLYIHPLWFFCNDLHLL